MEILGREFKGPFDIHSEELPSGNCVYVFVRGESPEFEPLYIGKSVNLKQRIKAHSQGSNLSVQIASGEIDKVYFCKFDKDDRVEADIFERLLIERFDKILVGPS